jgi:hypothetical protein
MQEGWKKVRVEVHADDKRVEVWQDEEGNERRNIVFEVELPKVNFKANSIG